MWFFIILISVALFHGSYSSCGYQSCPKTSLFLTNIHIVPHTHNDVGWLKTLDQYYYGGNNSIQDAGVQYILDSVIQELSHDPKKRFIYVETAFFWKWWEEQDDSVRDLVKNLVNNGQLEFVGGAWSMNDEAATHYQSIIDQFTWGFRRLSDIFGKCGRPKVGWQIDPFGHSRENAAIMAKLGFDGLFLGRIDWQDKMFREKQKMMEMLWHTSQNDDTEATELFTGVLYNQYSAPKGFCFDVNCHDEPIIDNVNSTEYNADHRVKEFLGYMRNYSKAYQTNHVLVTMGDDFMYMDAHMNFKNMDKLIKHINEIQDTFDSPFHAFYSTPSCYLKSINNKGKFPLKLPPKFDDFMPYSSDPNAFWTGYFTSRPTIKGFERFGNNFLQVCKQLYALAGLDSSHSKKLISLREAMGVMQHHDAVTGTEKQHVASDYSRILTKGINDCNQIADVSLRKLMKADSEINLQSCLLLNISSCSVTEQEDAFVVAVYNPLSRHVDRPVRMPIENGDAAYSIKCPFGKEIEHQIVEIPKEVLSIPGRKSKATAELVFIATKVPPLGFKSFYVSIVKGNKFQRSKMSEKVHLGNQPVTVGYENGVQLTLTAKGHLKSITVDNKAYPLSQTFAYYIGASGDNKVFLNRSSGAYIFRPKSSAIVINNKPETVVLKGDVVTEVVAVYSKWVSQVMRIYNGFKNAEFHWLVGPIDISDQQGKEVITIYRSHNIHNNGVFFTDSNGRESMKRTLNFRETWPVVLAEPVAGNYYPVTTRISVADGNKRFSVVTDRSQGGSSLKDGEMELMIHRRLLHDDAFGVEEALNETAFGEGLVARGTHYLNLENDAKNRMLIQEKVLDSWLFFTPVGGKKFSEWQSTYTMEYSGLMSALPDNVQILTLEPWSTDNFILRLEHIIEANDDPILSKPATIDLKDMFANWKIVSIHEMMLGANMEINESQRLHWNSTAGPSKPSAKPILNEDMIINLNPMQIRTFIINMEPKKCLACI